MKQILKATKFGCSAHLPMSKESIGKYFEVEEIKPIKEIELVLNALKDNKEAQETAKKLLLGF